MSSLKTSTEPNMTRRDAQRSPGGAKQRPEKPRPAASSYLLLIVAGLALALFFFASATSTLVVDFGFARVPLYPLIGTALLAIIVLVG